MVRMLFWQGAHFHRRFTGFFRGFGGVVGRVRRVAVGLQGCEVLLQDGVEMAELVEAVLEVAVLEAVQGPRRGLGDEAPPGLGRGGVEQASRGGCLDGGDEGAPGAGDRVAEVTVPRAVLGASFVEFAQLGHEGGRGGEVDAPCFLDRAVLAAGSVAAVVWRVLPRDRAEPVHRGFVAADLRGGDVELVGGLGDGEPDDGLCAGDPVVRAGPVEELLEMLDQGGCPSRPAADCVEEVADFLVGVALGEAVEGGRGVLGGEVAGSPGPSAGGVRAGALRPVCVLSRSIRHVQKAVSKPLLRRLEFGPCRGNSG